MYRPCFYAPASYCLASALMSFFISLPVQSQTPVTLPSDLDYRVVEDHRVRKVKLSLNIHLSRSLNEDALGALAQKLYSTHSGKTYDRVFMSYFLQRSIPGHGCWATTHFDPDIEVSIFGRTATEEHSLLRLKVPIEGKLIGKWIGDGGILFIERSESGYRLQRHFPDGSSDHFSLRDKTEAGDKRLVELKDDGSESQFYYRIRKNGDLALYNEPIFGPKTPSVVYKALPIPAQRKKKEAAIDAVERIWTDNTGKFTVKARFISSKAKSIRLLKVNGKVIAVPIERLSAKDREFIKEVAK